MTEQTSTPPTFTVTSGSPIGYLPVDGGSHGGFGLTVWECVSCGALINNVDLHEAHHDRLTVAQIAKPGTATP